MGALLQVEGTYGIAVISTREPDTIVAARRGSPLLVAIGSGEHFVASDASAVLSHTRSVVYLDDGEVAIVRPDAYRILDLAAVEKVKAVTQIDWDLGTIERGGYAALHAEGDPGAAREPAQHAARAPARRRRGRPARRPEPLRRGAAADQPHRDHRLRHVVARGADRRVHDGGAGPASRPRSSTPPSSATATRSWTSGRWSSGSRSRARRPTRWRRCARRSGAARARSASSTWSAARSRAKWTGASTCTPGPEIGVASTKAFTSQIAALALLTLKMGRLRTLSILQGREVVRALARLPELVRARARQGAGGRAAGRAAGAGEQRPVSGARLQLPGGARGGAEAEGDLLHPRRGLPRRRDEARADRADRRADAGRVHRAARRGLPEDRCRTSKR